MYFVKLLMIVSCLFVNQATGEEPDVLYKSLYIEVKGHDTAVLNSYQKFATMTAEHLGIKIGNM